MNYCIIIHYDEIGLKGKNRDFFEQKLVENLSEKIKLKSLKGRVQKIFGRLRIDLPQKPTDEERNQWQEIGETTFGIAYFGFAIESGNTESDLKEVILELASSETFESFRITASRTEKIFPMTSMEINHMLGGTILKNLGPKKVKLKNPDAEFFVEVMGKKSFSYVNKQHGPGGLPVGTAGKGLVLMSGGIDSPVAAFYMMKRGMKLHFIHFHSYPQTSKKSVDKVRQLVQDLKKFDPNLTLHMCPFLDIQKEVLKTIPDKFRIIFYRRIMLKIAEKCTQKINAKALITGESLSQVASQTIENMTAIEQAMKSIPILRPLIGFDKHEIITVAKTIGTFQTSIKPHEDCCTVFMPQNPETKAKLDEVLALEKKLDTKQMIQEGLEKIEVEKI